MSLRRLGVAIVGALVVAGCATVGAPPSSMWLQRLPGWRQEDHAGAFALVRRVCMEAPAMADRTPCPAAIREGPLGEAAARRFLEAHYRARPLEGRGVLTAYFSPTYDARLRPGGAFSAPVRPPSPVSGPGQARAAIEQAPAADALAWMRPEDLFFLQIEGGGVLVFPDGTRARATFAGSNGRPFVAVSGEMVRRRLIAPGSAAADAVHDWLARHRGVAAEAVMRLNPRYVYFRLGPDDGEEPRGAAKVPLVAGRSLAIDPAYHPFFELLWVDGRDPILDGAMPVYQRLAAAMDVGAAIEGPVRADLYLGRGPAAGAEAARVRHALRLYRLVPADGER